MVFCVAASPFLELHAVTPETVRRLFAELADLGIGGVKVDYQAPETGVEWLGYAAMIAEGARECGLRISAHAPTPDISATDPAARRDAVTTVREYIARIGLDMPGVVIAVHPEDHAPIRNRGDDEARIESCRGSVEELAKEASAVGARIALENMRHRPDASNRTGMFVDQLSEIVADADPSTVGICFDTGHANISERDDLAAVFERNAARIIHIHYDDNLGVDDSQLPPGEGNIDFDALFHVAANSGYDGMVELEVKVPDGDDPRAFLERSVGYYRQATG